MIDDNELALWEISALWASENKSFPMQMSITKLDAIELAEITRNARRYLALREHGVIADLKQDAEWLFAGQLDAAADRMLEGAP